jgi:Amino acid kinase family
MVCKRFRKPADKLSLARQDGVIKDLVLLSCVGVRPVFVHGGGPEINTWLNKLGIEAQFKGGLRVTDGEQMPFVRFAYAQDLATDNHHSSSHPPTILHYTSHHYRF